MLYFNNDGQMTNEQIRSIPIQIVFEQIKEGNMDIDDLNCYINAIRYHTYSQGYNDRKREEKESS